MMVSDTATREVGYVTQVKGYLLTLEGLPSVRVNDIIADRNGRKAIVNSLSSNSIDALLLDHTSAAPGDRFFVYHKGTRVNMGEYLKGEVLNALGSVVSGYKSADVYEDTGDTRELRLDVVAENINARDYIREQLITGYSLIDILVPVGKGQRELVYGSMQSGKTEFLQNVIINQKRQGVTCIYAAIGKPVTFTTELLRGLRAADVLDNTVIVSALSDEPTPMIAIAPSTAFMVAEYFCRRGEDVVLVLDDLGIHAKYLREIALLSGRLPGRESYPGDIFYQHAHLMERAGSFNEKQGGGTITLFPVLEADEDSLTDLIPTNLMASTDGHLFFSSEMHTEGYAPAVSVPRSVTRVGHTTQSSLQRDLSTKLMTILSEYPRQLEYSRFGTQMSKMTRDILKKGEIINELLNQNTEKALSVPIQTVLLSLVFSSFFEKEENTAELVRLARADIIGMIEESDAFAEARTKAEAGTDPIDVFIEEVDRCAEALEGVCQKYRKQEKS